ncbi:alpha/beta hydrolase [Nocardia sp. NPDC003482]
MERVSVAFDSAGVRCAAWHYLGSNGTCVVMAAGLGVPKEPGTDRFARAFAAAGFGVLAFDYRGLGASGGGPRQVVRFREQLRDWDAALARARTLDGVDPRRIAIWGFSASGGHVLRVAAEHPELGAAIAFAPNADGWAGIRNALRETPLRAMGRLVLAAGRDVAATAVGRAPLLVPLTGPAGSVAALTTADSRNGPRALDPRGEYRWRPEVAARSAVRIGFDRPGRVAPRIAVPLLVLVHEEDGVAPHEPAARAGRRAPHGEVVRLPGGHYAGFLDGFDAAVTAQLNFLRRRLVSSPTRTRSARPPGRTA